MPKITMVVSTLFIQLAVWLLLCQHPIITAVPENEAEETSGGACAPKDCVYREWTLWSECTKECGEDGVRQRVRRMLGEAECGGACHGTLEESEPCNVRCCPTNCVYGDWSVWLYCKCSEDECDQVRLRFFLWCLKPHTGSNVPSTPPQQAI